MLLDAGADPPSFQPTAAQVLRASEASLLVASGAGYEAWVGAASLPLNRLVLAADGQPLIEIAGLAHDHGEGGLHSHSGPDPHLWMDPARYARQGQRVGAALSRILPDRSAEIEALQLILEEELRLLGAEWEAACPVLRGRPLAANHPSFTYLAERCGVAIQVIDLDPEQPVGEAALAALTGWRQGDARALLLWEAAPTAAVAAQVGGLQLTLDPLEQPGPGGRYDYLGQARDNVARLKALGAP